MIKKTLLSIALLALSLTQWPFVALAQVDPEEIKDQLITNIASRVAQLKLVEKRGIVGTVTEVSNTQITLLDLHNNIRFIDVDELTKFTSLSAKGSFGISDISKDTTIGVLGLYNKESRRILARFVDVLTFPKKIYGTVAFVDSKNFTLDIKTADKQITVDVEATTKTLLYTKEAGLVSSGFSKIKENQVIFAVLAQNPKNKEVSSASKIIFFPSVLRNTQNVAPPNAQKSDAIVPSTGSGKKLTPIVK